jgi:hypothetical protein
MKLDEWLQSEVQLEDMETQSPMMSIFTAELEHILLTSI